MQRPSNAATSLSSYANDPLENSFRQQLIPRLRDYLKGRLPEHMLPFHDTNSVQYGNHLGDEARGGCRVSIQEESAEPPLRIRRLEQRHLCDAGSARGDGLPNARQELDSLPGERLAVGQGFDTMRTRSEIPQNRVATRAGDMESAADAVPRRRALDRQRAEDLRRLPADPFHRLQEERTLDVKSGVPFEVGPVAARTGGVRPRETLR